MLEQTTLVALAGGAVGGVLGVWLGRWLSRLWHSARHRWRWRGYRRDPRGVYARNFGLGSWEWRQARGAWEAAVKVWDDGGRNGPRPPAPPPVAPVR